MTAVIDAPPFEVDDEIEEEATPPIPKFEGKEVRSVESKFGAFVLDDPDLIVTTGDVIRLVVEVKVGEVKHCMDKDGELQRTHLGKVLQAQRVPYDASDPTDDGVIRS